ncbi:unnamed protein product [Diatraea saccharalis]|uniref:Uncharacterized protein n=1 Tax=Diatraea saccharalis TaxID=40085 RepID=A0A9N9RES7_9NEOP|nr:unnamed protein product [Diatraea saccharalis]
MARLNFLVVVLCLIATVPILGTRGEEDNPLLNLASSFLQNMGNGDNGGNGLGALGSIMGALMQGDNAKNLGAMFGQNGDSGNNAGDVLSGIGSLLGGQDGKIDPALIGSVLSMFSQQTANNDQPKREKRQIKEEVKQQNKEEVKQQNKEENDINLGSILNLASGLLGNQNVASLLPIIMNTMNSFSEPETNKRAIEHRDHSSFLPPYLEKAHLYWDLFINSELGKTIWEKSGLRKATKAFTGPDGRLSFEMMFKSFENHSFRRHWIKTATKYLTDTFIQMSKPEVYQKYLGTTQYILNGFLSAQGLPNSIHFDMKQPEMSITRLINYALKKYMDIDTDVSAYVKPGVDYLRQMLKMAKTASHNLATRDDYNALTDRLTDTLNLQVIEPVLRVYRAYKHSIQAPHCQEHLMCLVNKHNEKDKRDFPGLKEGLTKISSIIASAALSYQDGKGFWDLYHAVESKADCEDAYPADCAAFHEHEQKVTTEVYHTEL